MYSYELKQFIESHNHELQGHDIILAIDPKLNPQLSHVKYNPFDNIIQMWDKEGNYFYFKPLPYVEQNKNSKSKVLKK